jgi:hypothetical protein
MPPSSATKVARFGSAISAAWIGAPYVRAQCSDMFASLLWGANVMRNVRSASSASGGASPASALRILGETSFMGANAVSATTMPVDATRIALGFLVRRGGPS